MFSRRRIKLDPTLHDRAVARSKELGYSSVNEYISHLIERDAAKEQSDEREAINQLRGLGYIE